MSLASKGLFMVGNIVSNNGVTYILMLTAIALLIASMCVTYYTDGSGMASGVYSGVKCLGHNDPVNCQTMEALPVVTVILALFTLMFMSAHASIPYFPTRLLSRIESVFVGSGSIVVPLIVLTVIFSIATLVTQLETPISMSGSVVSLSDQSQKACNANPITFKDGMALSSASTALFVSVFLIMLVKAENMGKLFSY